MNYLIDSHTFLWFGTNDRRLPPGVADLIKNPENEIRICIASFWEIAIKFSIGKLPLATDIFGLEAQADSLDIEIIPITVRAIQQTTLLPKYHKDPFDRIIAATALITGNTLLSVDPIFDSYGVKRVWQAGET